MLRILDRHAKGVFDPVEATVLVAAFDQAWERLERSGARYGSDRVKEAARQQLGKCIIEIAKSGERDPKILCEDALLLMAKESRR
jgi:hypothetical protein